MNDNTNVRKVLEALTREVPPPILSESQSLNAILGRQRTMTLRVPILTHWLLHRAALSVGCTKTALAQDLIEAAAQDAFDALQASGHLPNEININEARQYYLETTKIGEASEEGDPVELFSEVSK